MVTREPAWPATASRLAAWRADVPRPGVLAGGVVTGAVVYSVGIMPVLAVAALIFSGRLAGQFPVGLGLALVGSAVLCAMVALLSSYPGSIATSQDTSAVLLAAPAASIVAALPAASPAQQVATEVVLFAGTAVVTGLCLLLLGLSRRAGLVRFLPFPVLGGFLAGTGWLLAAGGIGVMAGTAHAPDLLRPALAARWLPGVLLGVVLLVVLGRTRHPLALPGLCAGAILAFYAVAWASGTSQVRLSADGWLLGPFPSGSLWRFPLSPAILGQINWSVLLGQLPAVAPILLVSTIGLLLNAGGLELSARRDIDLNRELVVTGVANLALGATGGLVGYTAISLSSLNHTMGGGRRVAGLVTALLLGATAFVGVGALNAIPTLLPGGLLLYLGLDLLHEWIYRTWFTCSRIEWLIIVLIMGVIATRGFLAGIVVGLVLAVVVFVVSASRTNVVKHALSGLEYHSRVTRGPGQQAFLRARGGELYVLQLQGVIFFGTAHTLYERIRARATDPGMPALRFVVLDFAQVTGLDATGLHSFTKLRRLAQAQRLTLVLTGLSGGVGAQFARGGFGEQPGVLRIFVDLDHGLEWCEDAIIATEAAQEQAQRLYAQPGAVPEQPVAAGTQQAERGSADQPPMAGPEERQGLRAQLEAILPPGCTVDRLLSHLRRREISAGAYLIRQGDEPGVLFFIESGQVTAQLEAVGQPPVRLETMRSGRVVGELGFYLGGRRTAAVVVDEPSTVYCLAREDLERIEGTDPLAASLLHRTIVHLLGERVVHLISAVEALQR